MTVCVVSSTQYAHDKQRVHFVVQRTTYHSSKILIANYHIRLLLLAYFCCCHVEHLSLYFLEQRIQVAFP